MKPKQASRTAQYMALFRAIETARPKDRLFEDHYAKIFLDAKLRSAAKISTLPWIGKLIPKFIDSKGPGAFTSGIARTKYIDDLLQQTVEKGVRQVIILGSGFDTRATRLPFLKDRSIIEIDHPDTALFKMTRLKKECGQLPSNVKYIQLDFNKENIVDVARRELIDFNIPTTLLWEGVSNYVSAAAVNNTFQFASTFAKQSYLIFTYIDRLVLERPDLFFGTAKIRKTLDESHEQWTFGFYPSELPGYANAFHLHVIEDKSADEYRKIYMPQRKDFVRGYEFYRVALLSIDR